MMGSDSLMSRICSWPTMRDDGSSAMCRKIATEKRRRHYHANVGVDNFFFVDTHYCDDHAQIFDNNPPPGHKAWMDYEKRKAEGLPPLKPRDPYLGTKKTTAVSSSKQEAPTSASVEPKKKSRPKKNVKGATMPDHPTCTNITMMGDVCCKPIARKFIGKGAMYQLCPDCAADLEIT